MTKLVKFFQGEAKNFAEEDFEGKAFMAGIYLICLLLLFVITFFASMIAYALWMLITKATLVFFFSIGIVLGILGALFAFNAYGKRLLKKNKQTNQIGPILVPDWDIDDDFYDDVVAFNPNQVIYITKTGIANEIHEEDLID